MTVTQNVLDARLSAPNRRNVYCPAICDRLAITRMSASRRAQPAIQPVRGPIPLVTHVNEVPQSGSTRFHE